MGSISGMVSQLTCCSLVFGDGAGQRFETFLFRFRRLRAFAHPPAGKAKQGAEQQKRQMWHSRHYRQYDIIPVAVKHRWACQQLVTHVMGDRRCR